MEDNIRMDPKEIDINTRIWVDSAQEGLLESPCECSIESPGSKAMELVKKRLQMTTVS